MFDKSYSNILIKLRQPVSFEPDDLGKSYIPQKRAKRRKNWLKIWNWEELGPKIQNINFNEKGPKLTLKGVVVF